jgi:hypothetical protein
LAAALSCLPLEPLGLLDGSRPRRRPPCARRRQLLGELPGFRQSRAQA